jgi:methylenetetrahydrofolate reductase (NADPH)
MNAGADRAITQYFFDIELFLRLRDRAHLAGITLPLVPGIVTIGHFAQLRKFSAMCGASIPTWLAARMEGLDETPTARDRIAVEIATELAQNLLREGVEQLHFYTLNRADLSAAICGNLGVVPVKASKAKDFAESS